MKPARRRSRKPLPRRIGRSTRPLHLLEVTGQAQYYAAVNELGCSPFFMVSKAKKSDFLANFATERQFLRPLLDLMLLQRGKFYSFQNDLDVAQCPDENLLVAWLEAAEEDDGYRSIVCLDPRDLWTGYALIHYPSYLERQAESLNRIH